MKNLLAGLTILDFTHRLPGPFGCYLLSNLGANVIKVEDHKFRDPFIEGAFPQIDSSFSSWYKEFNQNKEILRLDFKSPQIKDEISKLLLKADGVILAGPSKVKQNLGLDKKTLMLKDRPLAIVELLASAIHQEKMHDLNALALNGVLKLHTHQRKEKILPPPFLPLAGIGLGLKAALDLLAAIIKSREVQKPIYNETFLLETTDELFNPFWPKEMRSQEHHFLHNGRYPCYCLYQTKDEEYVALASVEEKLWLRFCEVFNLEIDPNERFRDKDDQVFTQISDIFQKLDSKSIKKMIENEDFCLTLVGD